MKIKYLIEREDFHLVLKKTLEKFFRQKSNSNIKIELTSYKNIGENYFLINPDLNIIYPSDISSKIIYPFIKKYFYHNYKKISILQKIYFKFVISKIFRRNFSIANILISPKEVIKNCIICGGNHSISIIELNDK